MAQTSIEWTRSDDGAAGTVWNPTTGCDRVSPGCDHCYALTMARRLKGMGSAKYQRDGDPRTSGPGFGITEHPDALGAPLRWRKPRRIFVNSMSDLFHQSVSDAFIARVWQAMGAAPQHTYQVLTKRHGRMRSWVNRWYSGEIAEPYEERPAPGFPGYTVTTLGQVCGKRRDTANGLSEDIGEQGHRRVTMHREGSPRSGEHALVHRLVLEAFVRPARPGEQACHRNGDPSDNRLSNLYWGTQRANWQDRIRHGHHQSYTKLTEDQVNEIRRRHAGGASAYGLAREYPVSDTQIRNIVREAHWATSAVTPPGLTKPARAVLDCVWLGVSVEDQQRADLRIPALLQTPAAVRWLSCEPLLGEVDIERWICRTCLRTGYVDDQNWSPEHPELWRGERSPGDGRVPCGACNEGGWHVDDVGRPGIDWVVVGGESGAGARPMHPDWARQLRDACTAAGVPYFFKQHGEFTSVARDGDPWLWREPAFWMSTEGRQATEAEALADGGSWVAMHHGGKKLTGRELDGRTWDEYPTAAGGGEHRG